AELDLGGFGNVTEGVDFVANNILEGDVRLGLDGIVHFHAGALFYSLQLGDEFGALACVGDVIGRGGFQHGGHILRRVGQGGVRAGGDALHALGAVLGDIDRSLAA